MADYNRYPTFDEKHSSRVALDEYQAAFDQAKAAGLSNKEAANLANQAAANARRAYNGGK